MSGEPEANHSAGALLSLIICRAAEIGPTSEVDQELLALEKELRERFLTPSSLRFVIADEIEAEGKKQPSVHMHRWNDVARWLRGSRGVDPA